MEVGQAGGILRKIFWHSGENTNMDVFSLLVDILNASALHPNDHDVLKRAAKACMDMLTSTCLAMLLDHIIVQ